MKYSKARQDALKKKHEALNEPGMERFAQLDMLMGAAANSRAVSHELWIKAVWWLVKVQKEAYKQGRNDLLAEMNKEASPSEDVSF